MNPEYLEELERESWDTCWSSTPPLLFRETAPGRSRLGPRNTPGRRPMREESFRQWVLNCLLGFCKWNSGDTLGSKNKAELKYLPNPISNTVASISSGEKKRIFCRFFFYLFLLNKIYITSNLPF